MQFNGYNLDWFTDKADVCIVFKEGVVVMWVLIKGLK